ncbi:conserved phage C-terminal domain-containing protein [Clostridium gasigenes]|uniref:conserved phage C-terminal domain-containing protein n=1 Tax=Clostridium gasigenes TaxID=94869 RepID=UPI00162923B9|nr:conserved phage C-terminal domain-containing protein [Clostridium gasigenes]MBB6622423.1 conserved phage C-terminal domain-containing protein [Clostridium gasigenes]MBU3087193.1 conserved phage C-terminal domain-containing protein [Clostridium gasigenes]
MKKEFKGIWIPSELWLNKDLGVMEKIFLVEITSLDREKGCYASNGYFSEFFSLSKTRCSAIIRTLRDKGYITIKLMYEEGKKFVKSRIIKVIKNIKSTKEEVMGSEDPEEENIEIVNHELEKENQYNKEGYFEDNYEKLQKVELSKCDENLPKDSVEKIEYDEKNDYKNPIYSEVIEYLNDKCEKNYKYNTETTRKLIKDRLTEGFCIEDFLKVINKKNEEWSNSPMEEYLRPGTLFGEKFERYLTEAEMNLKPSSFNNNFYLNGGQAYDNGYNNFENNRSYNKKTDFGEKERVICGDYTPLTEDEIKWAEENLF